MPQKIELDRLVPRWAVPFAAPMRYKGLSGGRGSGKSHLAAEAAVEAMVCDPSLRFVCIREVQRSLEFSAKALVELKIRALGVSHLFEVQQRLIKRRGGTGVMIFEGMQDHTADSIKSLEGFTRAWVEEAQSLSQRSFEMLLPTILRSDNAEIWFTWNPRFKTDAVDAFFRSKPEKSLHIHTTYLDNPWCSAGMREEAARQKAANAAAYDHIWLGLYDMGSSGRVYSSFSARPYPEGNVDDSVRDLGGDIYVGQDFNVNPMASVIAVRAVDEMHVIDSFNVMTSNTTEVAGEITRRYPNRRVIFCPDPAGNQRRTSATVVGQTDFTILKDYGFEVRAPAAHPAVVDRVNNSNLMFFDPQSGRRRTRIHPRCETLIEALQGFTYKENTSIPDKNGGFDHPCFTGATLVETRAGLCRMDELPESGEIRGPYGEWEYYQGARMTRSNAAVIRVQFGNGEFIDCTPDHRILTPFGWKPAAEISSTSGYITVCDMKSLAARSSGSTDWTTICAASTSSARARGYTASSTQHITGQFQTECTCTTGTPTVAIMHPKISNYLRRTRTWRGIWQALSGLRRHVKLSKRPAKLLLSGTAVKRGASGTLNTMAVCETNCTRLLSSSVRTAERQQLAPCIPCFAEKTAPLLLAESLDSMMRSAIAVSVAHLSSATNTKSLEHAVSTAAHSLGNVVSVTARPNADVYDLSVPGVGCFLLANGVVVSNCDALSYAAWQEFNVLTPKAIWGTSTFKRH